MRVLVLNANTNKAMTDHALAHARRLAPEIEFTGATGRFGSTHIGTRATYAIASHAAIDCFAAEKAKYDAIILACFGDPGLGALQDLAVVPAFGLAETASRAAAAYKQPFSIVTGGQRWVALLTEYLAGLGLTEHLASIRTVNVTGSQILADPDRSLDALARTCRIAKDKDGASRVILGGAGLIGLAEKVAVRADSSVIDCLEPAIAAVRAVCPRSPPSASSTAVANEIPMLSGIDPLLAKRISDDFAKDV
jgi:allantoin racemase